MPLFLGLDTSNYTTSAALYRDDTDTVKAASVPLSVPVGKTGLRQNDALFLHVKSLPEVIRSLGSDFKDIRAIGVSAKPSGREGSYMPCFLAGLSLAKCLGEIIEAPVYEFTHQQGHIASAAWSVGHTELLRTEHLAWHLSGGTTELLHVFSSEKNIFDIEKIGGSLDLTAGQLIDRAGGMLGLTFPAGKQMDELSQNSNNAGYYRVKTDNLYFSLSGLENKAKELLSLGKSASEISSYLINSISMAVYEATLQAQEKFKGLPVLCSGGVSANLTLRKLLSEKTGAVFAKPEYASDNAAGPALLAYLSLKMNV